jgi:hypothetical protein
MSRKESAVKVAASEWVQDIVLLFDGVITDHQPQEPQPELPPPSSSPGSASSLPS